MFAVLEHQAGEASATPGAPGAAVHWDLLIEIPGQERLATWRLAENPLQSAHAIAAEPCGDHRRVYLEFEGELSGGRGRVRRLDRGEAQVTRVGTQKLQVELRGAHLRGRFCIALAARGQLMFERAEPKVP